MTDNQFSQKFLDINQPIETSPTRFSTLALLLKSARKLSGRNLSTGKYEFLELNEDVFNDGIYLPFQFTGMINYLILLEQLGSIFKPIGVTPPKEKNGIFSALTYFSVLGDQERRAVKALRNTLTHKFGLATEKKPNSGSPMKFTISRDRSPRIIELPKKDWDGTFTDKSENTNTIVYLFDLLDLAESIYERICLENAQGKLEIILQDGIPELKARYTIL